MPTARRSRGPMCDPRTLERARADSNTLRAPNESADTTEQADPIEKTEPAEPIEPTESTEPDEPIERIEP